MNEELNRKKQLICFEMKRAYQRKDYDLHEKLYAGYMKITKCEHNHKVINKAIYYEGMGIKHPNIKLLCDKLKIKYLEMVR